MDVTCIVIMIMDVTCIVIMIMDVTCIVIMIMDVTCIVIINNNLIVHRVKEMIGGLGHLSAHIA